MCLTCGARARSVGAREIVRTGQSRSTDANQAATRGAACGRRPSKSEWKAGAHSSGSDGLTQ